MEGESSRSKRCAIDRHPSAGSLREHTLSDPFEEFEHRAESYPKHLVTQNDNDTYRRFRKAPCAVSSQTFISHKFIVHGA